MNAIFLTIMLTRAYRPPSMRSVVLVVVTVVIVVGICASVLHDQGVSKIAAVNWLPFKLL